MRQEDPAFTPSLLSPCTQLYPAGVRLHPVPLTLQTLVCLCPGKMGEKVSLCYVCLFHATLGSDPSCLSCLHFVLAGRQNSCTKVVPEDVCLVQHSGSMVPSAAALGLDRESGGHLDN
jgi:hypothetical protein